MRLALLLLLVSCGRPTGIVYPREVTATYSRAFLDSAADCIARAAEARGVLTPGVAAEYFRTSTIAVSVYRDEAAGGVTGRHDPTTGNVTVTWQPGDDIVRSSLLHELVHALLCRLQDIGPDCWGDMRHEARAWWTAVLPDARDCWAEAERAIISQ